MRTFGFMALAAVAGYAVGIAVGYWMVNTFSSNRHDKQMEAAMTSAFVFGPAGSVLAMLVTWVML